MSLRNCLISVLIALVAFVMTPSDLVAFSADDDFQGLIFSAAHRNQYSDDNYEMRLAKTYKPSTYSGARNVVLKRNIVNGVSVLTQEMVKTERTIYIIKYDFVLSSNIKIPANCVLKFEGGSIKSDNFLINLNNTEIVGNKCINCRLSGNIYNDKVSLSIFGESLSDQYKISTAFTIASVVLLEDKGIYNIQYGIDIAKETTVYGNDASIISDDFCFRTFSPLYVYNLSIKAVKESIVLEHDGENNVEKAIIESCNLSTSTINDNTIYGLKSYCDDLVVRNCTLSGGVWVAHISNSHLREGTYVRFENNIVSNGFGLVHISNLSGGIISGNICMNTKQFGICTLQSKGIRIFNNEVKDFCIDDYSTGNGIVLSENSYDCVVSNNKCIVTNDCSGGIVSDTQLSKGKSGGRNFISGNEVVFLNNSAGNGIIINGSDACTVDNNHIVKSTVSGIHSAYSDDVTISGNILDQCSNTLIQCDYANNNVINNNTGKNLIENKCDRGIFVGNCINAIVSHNTIILNSNQNCYNIYFRYSTGIIKNNSFSQEGAHGFVCVFANYSSDVVATNNTFTSKGAGLNYLYRIGHASKLVASGNVYEQRDSKKDCKAFISNESDCAIFLNDILNGREIKTSLIPR